MEEIMIGPVDRAILEIGAGSWFITSIALVIVFGYHIVQRFLYDPDWKHSVTTQASIAFMAYGAGSAMRAGLAWIRFSTSDYAGAGFILTWWPWFEVSILLNAVGAAAAIYILSPGKRAIGVCTMLAVAFLLPFLVWLI